jgi:uncharacterized membrane protein YidH (DUF202 family)
VDDRLINAGAQAERTALAWQRTGIGVMAIGALLMHMSVNHHLVPSWPGLLLMAVAGFAVLVLVPQRYRRVLHTVRAGQSPVSRGMVPGATLLVVLVTIGIGIAVLRG